jgi:putative (di)nucleoside polyphosphate hydrolase
MLGPMEYRSGVGIVLMNHLGLVFVGHRKDDRSPAWQMPQGGLRRGEAPEQATLRELSEELGTDKAAIISSCSQWLCYDYPKASPPRRALQFRGQRLKWFLLRFTGHDQDISVATTHPEFSSWRWMSPEDVIANVISFKRDNYRAVMRHFAPLLGHPENDTTPLPPFLVKPNRQQDDHTVNPR